jgi:uncharacterized membrane protein YfcA
MEIFWKIPLILVTGVFAGFLNTVAGGGSLLTLPVLIDPVVFNLPHATANGTNRIAVFIQNASGIMGFRRKGVSDFGYSALLALPALVGAWFGAKIAVEMNDIIFNRVLAGIMIAVLFLTLFNPTKKLQSETANLSLTRKIIGMLVFFFVGIYGGFIQAGVGFIIIAALTLTNGFDLVRTNAIKLFVVFFYTVSALIVFIKSGNVNWSLGLTLAVGNATGAWIGSHWAVAKGDKWIRIVLVVAVLAFAIRLFWQTLG